MIILAMLHCTVSTWPIPQWEPTWSMAESTVIMPCNNSGYTDPALYKGFGLVDFDWSNAKLEWSNAKPMDCQERLVHQAEIVKSTTPYAKVFIYRNLVKALPWYSEVRDKMLDPNYAGWFLKFAPNGAAGLPAGEYYSPPCNNESRGGLKCSKFYHDQEQTPQAAHTGPPAPGSATRVQEDDWYIYNNTNDVNALHPGFRTVVDGGKQLTPALCKNAADKAGRKIFTWWSPNYCWLSSEWSYPTGMTGTLPIQQAMHTSGYKPADPADPAPLPPGASTGLRECNDGDCDCGPGLPCGEYLWDHRNASLREWLIDEFILGKVSGLGNPNVDGFYVDDSWSTGRHKHFDNSTWHSCDSGPIGGATEEEKHCSVDMGLTAQDVAEITGNWSITKQQAQTAVLANKGFLWGSYSMFVSTGARTFDPPATRRPGSTDPRTTCTAWMREACNVDSRQQNSALLFEFTRKTFHDPFPLPAVVEDVAMFLLSRGPFAWLGHNWMGCFGEYFAPNATAIRPAQVDVDYGTPIDTACKETSAGSAIFTREYSKASVEMDCNSFIGKINMH